MNDSLVRTIEDVAKRIADGRFRSQAEISQGVVMRILGQLGWPIFDVQVVVPEFGTKKVAYALCHPPAQPVVLVEVKDLGNADGRGERRLLESCTRQRVPMGVLTDGRTWSFFFLSGHRTGGAGTQFARIDLDDEDYAEAVLTLSRYLDREDVAHGAARRRAERDYEAEREQMKAAAAFASVWRRLVAVPNPLLLDVFSQEVESATGVRPDRDRAAAFVRGRAEPEPDPRPPPPSKQRPSFAFQGKKQNFRNGSELMGAVFEALASQDPDFCRRYSQRFSGRTRRYVAESAELLCPATPHHASQAISLPGGWWLNTAWGNTSKLKRIEEACKVAGLQLGKDIIVHMPVGSRAKRKPEEGGIDVRGTR